ncbi:MAG: glycogen-binding domain-containing protein [bacterium]
MKPRQNRTSTRRPIKEAGAAVAGNGDKAREIEFLARASDGSEVFLAGSFNSWDPKATPLEFSGDSSYSTTLKLPRGRYEYKFIVNGKWQIDEQCKNWVPNLFGSLNSVLEIA